MSERIDDIGFGGYKLIQDTEGFCYGTDAVLLADFAKCRENDVVMDLGTGNGIVPIIVYAKYHPAQLAGIELQPKAFELAVRNSQMNGMENVLVFYNGDVKDVRANFEKGSFTVVTSNPPYTEKGRGPVSSDAKLAARHETSAGLEDFISAAEYLLKKSGSFYMVHRPSRLADIISLLRKYGLEPKKLQMVAPHQGEAANIVLVQAVKGAGHELTVLPELVVRKKDGSFTSALAHIYKY